MPLQATSGAASYDAFGGGVAAVPNYIEECFSTFLYQGNGSTQTINNGIDLAGKGGLVWGKNRSAAANNFLANTVLGASDGLISNSTGGNTFDPDRLTAFTASGFSVGTSGSLNTSGNNYVSWTWAEAPKFFDVVTLTADGSGNATFSHNLGATPGCVILKRTDGVSSWVVWHRGLTSTNFSINLNTTSAQADNGFAWITPGSSTVSINGGYLGPNTQWVAYLFAHDAGGFGLSGTDNVISCGSFTTNSSGIASVTLGYEPQWVLIKRTDSLSEWHLLDTMRGFSQSTDAWLRANSSAAENSTYSIATPNATGFTTDGTNIIDPSSTFIYIAIRRGPMRTPTTGTSVFAPTIGVASTPTFVGNFPVDFCIAGARGSTDKWWEVDRLRGPQTLNSASTAAESSAPYVSFDNMIGCMTDSFSSYLGYVFRRAPGFFDEVCYTGTGSARTVAHNLTVAPELIIVKSRSNAYFWPVYAAPLPLGASDSLTLNQNFERSGNNVYWNQTSPTASVFSLGTPVQVNQNTSTYVAYLFASCPGVSKVGSYTGNGTSQTINCGFAAGARFVMVKRTDSSGDWYVWDTARGIVSGNDPYLLLNSTAAEVTNTDTIDTDSTGFVVNQVSATNVNVSSATYIFLAIA